VFEIGSTLREARRRQGLELAEIARETLIRERYLAALEEERLELMPARAYAKGFLRVYADFLGLDAQLFVDAFNSRFPETELPELAPLREMRTHTWGHRIPAALSRGRLARQSLSRGISSYALGVAAGYSSESARKAARCSTRGRSSTAAPSATRSPPVAQGSGCGWVLPGISRYR
jgi:hypothetical protein